MTDIISSMTEQEKLARTAWGEERGLGVQGMTATLCTINNRLLSGRTWWGTSLGDIATFGHNGIYQYSAWNVNDPNRVKLLAVTASDPKYAQALDLAAQLLAGKLTDITGGADSYFDKRLPRWPVWYLGLTPTFTCGHQMFFNTVKRSIAAQAAATQSV